MKQEMKLKKKGVYVTGASVTSGTAGHYTTVAIRKDGSFYDLEKIINK